MIILAFPGAGKTTLTNSQYQPNDSLHVNYLELDSSAFRKDKEGKWIEKYVDELIELDQTHSNAIVFGNIYEEVVKSLVKRNVYFSVVVPGGDNEKDYRLMKEMIIGRLALRDNSHIYKPERWLKTIIRNYDKWVSKKYLESLGVDSIKYLTINRPYLVDIM